MSVYTQAKLRIANQTFDWTTRPVRALLVENAYSYNFVHRTVSDVAASEVSGGTYARVDVPGRELRLDVAGDRALFWAPNVVFPLLNGVSPGGVILYEEVGPDENTPADDWLVAYLSFGGPVVTSGLDLLVDFATDGVFAMRDC